MVAVIILMWSLGAAIVVTVSLWKLEQGLRTRTTTSVGAVPVPSESPPNAPNGAVPYETSSSAEDSEDLIAAASQIAIHIWRLGKDLENAGDTLGTAQRRLERHYDNITQRLQDAEVTIRDDVDRKYDAGMALNVLAREKRAGLDTETIIETVKPTILYRNKVVSLGEVIVGYSEGEDDE